MLTNAKIHDAKPRSTRYEITCDALPGFALRVLPTGKKVFLVRFRDEHGKDRRQKLGQFGPDLNADQARRKAMALLAQRAVPEDDDEPEPASEPAPARRTTKARTPAPTRRASAREPPRSPLLRDFAEQFEQEHIAIRLGAQTASHYRSAIGKYLLPAFGDRRLDDITTADVQRFHNSLRRMPSAANYARVVLGTMFSKAAKWGITTRRNPVIDVERFPERSIERFLTPDERHALEQLLTTAEQRKPNEPGYIGRESIAAIRLLALTGMRRDEVLDLRWEYVDWRQRMLRLPHSKTGKRDVVVSDAVMDLLARIAEAKGNPRRGLVVCSRNGLKLRSLGVTWRRIRERAGIPDVRLHDLRHSVASDAIMNGVPLEVVGKMLGHRNYRTTQRYAHIADHVLRDAVNLTSQTIVRAANGESSPPARRHTTRP